MSRKSCGFEDLRSFDPEIEATFWVCQCGARNLSREANEVQEVIVDLATMPLRDFAMLDPNSVTSRITRPPIKENNFQFNLGLITLF